MISRIASKLARPALRRPIPQAARSAAPAIARDTLKTALKPRTFLVHGVDFPGTAQNGMAWLKPFAEGLKKRGVQDVVPLHFNTSNFWRNQWMLVEEIFSQKYTRRLYDDIMQDLATRPLKSGQGVAIVGHSMGGRIARNLVPRLEKSGVRVDSLAMLGVHSGFTPQNVFKLPNVGKVISIEDRATRFWNPSRASLKPFIEKNNHMGLVEKPSSKLLDFLARNL